MIGNRATPSGYQVFMDNGSILEEVGGQEADSFHIFSGENLREKAKQYMIDHYSDNPGEGYITINADGSCLISFMKVDEEVGNYVFSVDTTTGIGEIVLAEPVSVDFGQ